MQTFFYTQTCQKPTAIPVGEISSTTHKHNAYQYISSQASSLRKAPPHGLARRTSRYGLLYDSYEYGMVFYCRLDTSQVRHLFSEKNSTQPFGAFILKHLWANIPAHISPGNHTWSSQSWEAELTSIYYVFFKCAGEFKWFVLFYRSEFEAIFFFAFIQTHKSCCNL